MDTQQQRSITLHSQNGQPVQAGMIANADEDCHYWIRPVGESVLPIHGLRRPSKLNPNSSQKTLLPPNLFTETAHADPEYQDSLGA
jgi:hypothetical protein